MISNPPFRYCILKCGTVIQKALCSKDKLACSPKISSSQVIFNSKYFKTSKPISLVLHFTPFLIRSISVNNYYPVPERTLNQISQPKLLFLINFKHVSILPSCLPICQFSSLPIGLFVRFCFSICSFVNSLIACHFLSTYSVELMSSF